MSQKRKRVLIALSGGIASRVSASLLKTQGYELYGIHYYINAETSKYPVPQFFRKDSQTELQLVSKKLDISIHFEDVTAVFEALVLEQAIHRKLNGLPEITEYLFFSEFLLPRLYQYSQKIRADYIATGHFAKIVRAPDGSAGVLTVDEIGLDQSAELSRTKPEILNQMLLPIGDLSPIMIYKLDRELESRLKDIRPSTTEDGDAPQYAKVPPSSELQKILSSDLRFGKDYWEESWMNRYVSGDYFLPGPMRNQDEFGANQFNGVQSFEWGEQITDNPPQVIVEYHTRTRTVFLGPPSKLETSFFYLRDVMFLAPMNPMQSLQVQIKDPQNPAQWVNAKVTLYLGHYVTLVTEKALYKIGLGYPIVFYKENQVIGSGIVQKVGSLSSDTNLVSAPKQG